MKKTIAALLLLAQAVVAIADAGTPPDCEGKFWIDTPRGRLSAILKLPEGFSPGAKCPVAVLCHGFGADKCEKDGMFKAFADTLAGCGVASVRFDFNGHGRSYGRMRDMTVPKEVEDAKSVVRWAASQPWCNGKVSLAGHSQGGVVAAMAAGELGEKAISRVVLLAPACVLKDDVRRGSTFGSRYDPMNPPEVVSLPGGKEIGREFIKTAYDLPIFETAAKFQGPMCIIHGTGDPIAKTSHARRFHDEHPASDLHLMDGDDHGLSRTFGQVLGILAEFVSRDALPNCETPFAADVAAFGRVVDLWPEGKMPGDATDETEILDPGKPRGDFNYQKVSHPTLTIRRAPGEGTHPAMIICPGGAYVLLAWRKEGMEIARWANSLGIDAFILKYRVPGDGSVALMDAQRAVSWVRHHADELGVDPGKIAQIGFSAGANLTARTANGFAKRSYEPVDEVDGASCRPDATLLVYPGGLLKGGFLARPTPDLALADENIVTAETPPVFITQTEDDFCMVENSLAYYLACKKAGVAAAMLLGPKGGHGYGLRRTGRDNDAWPEIAAGWLKRTLK